MTSEHPGEQHTYRLECEVCGRKGVVRVSIDPAYPEEPDGNVCPTCGRAIAKEAHGGEHPSAGDHDPAPHVAAAYGTKP